MVSANRVAAINPPIDDYDTDPIRKFSIDSGSHTDWQNPAEFSPKGKPIRNFSIDPTSSIRTSIADAIFAAAISETPMNYLDLWHFSPSEFRNRQTRATKKPQKSHGKSAKK